MEPDELNNIKKFTAILLKADTPTPDGTVFTKQALVDAADNFNPNNIKLTKDFRCIDMSYNDDTNSLQVEMVRYPLLVSSNKIRSGIVDGIFVVCPPVEATVFSSTKTSSGREVNIYAKETTTNGLLGSYKNFLPPQGVDSDELDQNNQESR